MEQNFRLISIRDLTLADIPLVVNYWFHSPAGFIESIGVDPKKMPSEKDFENSLITKVTDNAELSVSKLNAVAILCDGKAIGVHTINPLVENDYGIFHAHIWNSDMRRRGTGAFSYPMAAALFMNRFQLKRILFKTPIQNTGAIRVKEKLGIRCVGEEVVSFGIIRDGTLSKVFELTRGEAEFLALKAEYPEVDLSQVQRNLTLSHEQRLLEHQSALDLVFELEKAGGKLREQSK